MAVCVYESPLDVDGSSQLDPWQWSELRVRTGPALASYYCLVDWQHDRYVLPGMSIEKSGLD